MIKKLLLGIALTCGLAFAQQPNEVLGLGATYQNQGHTKFSGAGFYAKQLTPQSLPTLYSFTEYDVVPTSFKPLNLQSNIRTGLAWQVYKLGPAHVLLCGDVGAGIVGGGAVGSFSGCGSVIVPINKQFGIATMVNGLKNSLSDPTVVWKVAFLYFR